MASGTNRMTGRVQKAVLLVGVLLALASCSVDESNRQKPWMTDQEKGFAIRP